MDFPRGSFTDEFLKANVLIYADKDVLAGEIGRFEGYCHYLELYQPEYEKQLRKVRAIVAALRRFRDVYFKNDTA